MISPAKDGHAIAPVDGSVDASRNGKPRRDRGEVLDTMPPAAVESELALLSAVMVAGSIEQGVTIPAYEFHDERNQVIWSALVTLDAEEGRIDAAAVLATLKQSPRWGQYGLDSAYVIGEVAQAGGAVGRQRWHADQIHAAYIKRSIGHIAERLLTTVRGGGELSAIRESLDTAAGLIDGPATKEPLAFTRLLTGGELLQLDLRPSFLVKGVLVDGQPMIIGGRSKAMKTSIAVDLVVSLGSGSAFLGRFDSQRVAVGFWSGESGAATIRETARRIADAKGVNLAESDCFWSFDLPRLSDLTHLDAMEEVIRLHGLRVAVIDPLYLCLLSPDTASGASNVFLMGSLLQGLTRLGQRTNCTMVLLHHFRKGGQTDDENPAALEELAQSGGAEWARQWLLLQRRSPYQGDGVHSLWLRCGGSAGHSSLWGVTIDEGLIDPDTFTGRRWEVVVSSQADARAESQRDREQRKAAEIERREGKHRDSLLEALRAAPGGDTARGLREATGLNAANFGKAIACLIQEGRAERCKVKKGNREENAFRPTGK